MAVQLHCAENVANIFTLLPPSHLSFSRSCLFPFCLSKEHIACCSLSGCHSTKSGRPLARCSRYMVSERLAETPEWPCDGVSGCLMRITKGGVHFGCPRLFPNCRRPAGLTLLRTHGCLCWKLQSYHLIPKLFFFLCMMNYSGNVFQSCHQPGQTQRERVRPHPRGPRKELVFSGSKKFQKKGFKARGCPPLGSEQRRYHTQAC